MYIPLMLIHCFSPIDNTKAAREGTLRTKYRKHAARAFQLLRARRQQAACQCDTSAACACACLCGECKSL
ncbi:MAG: hypothetical protein RR367_02830 [Clostridia bacterium]